MSIIDHPKNLIEWYEKQERVLTPAFLATIPWNQIKDHKIAPPFFPVLIYFRDVEKFTDVYYRELLRTPSGRDPFIQRFLEKWRTEEDLHAELLNRFLNEAGHETNANWEKEIRESIPWRYKFNSFLSSLLANFVGKRFTAVHMTWGAINELTTLQGYKQLWARAKHPVLEYMLKAIAREEAVHSFFYHSFAKMHLMRSQITQKLSRVIVDRFWTPVGQGTKPESEANMIIRNLFSGELGISVIDDFVTARLKMLPGFEGCGIVTKRVERVGTNS